MRLIDGRRAPARQVEVEQAPSADRGQLPVQLREARLGRGHLLKQVSGNDS